jgi:transcriptional regulator with XRE-family HTH domain
MMEAEKMGIYAEGLVMTKGMIQAEQSNGDSITVVPERLASLLRRHNMTPSDLARATGVHKSTISLMLSSKRQAVTTTNVAKIANVLAVSVDYLLGLSDTPETSKIKLGELPLELAQMAKLLPGRRQRDLIAMARTFMQMYAEQDLAQFQEDVLDLIEQYGGKEDRDQFVALLEATGGDIRALLFSQ